VRRAPNHQARLAQEQFSAAPSLLVQGLRPVLFVPSCLKGVKYPPRVIARALCLYNLGHSQEGRGAASRWNTALRYRAGPSPIGSLRYRSITTFHRFRAAAVLQFGRSMLKERTLDHQQVYQYKVHLAKLALTADVVPASRGSKSEGLSPERS